MYKKICSEKTEATIIFFEEKAGENEGEKLYCPVYRYYVFGKEFVSSDETYSSVMKGKAGDKVLIFYSKNNPNIMYNPQGKISLTLLSIAFTVLGLTLFLCQIFFQNFLRSGRG